MSKKLMGLLAVLFLCIAPAVAQTSQETSPAEAEEATTPETETPPPPGTTTAGPEGSEITPDEAFVMEKKMGIGITFGQTLLTGDERNQKTGFNNAIGQSVFLTYRFRERLNVALKYWTSQHEGRNSTSGHLKRAHITTELDYYLQRGIFSPYLIGGAGIYFSEFRPDALQKQAGIGSSSVNTFGVLFGAGVDFEINKNFILGLSATQHHSFKSHNAERGVEEAVPFQAVGMSAKTYF
jgi:outer membrane protein W